MSEISRNEIDARCTIRVGATEMFRGLDVKKGTAEGAASVIPGEAADQSFQLTMLRALLLPPRCRDVFVLTEMHGYTLPEVAKVLGISKVNAKRHLRRALREMEKH